LPNPIKNVSHYIDTNDATRGNIDTMAGYAFMYAYNGENALRCGIHEFYELSYDEQIMNIAAIEIILEIAAEKERRLPKK